jgi:hypothetical protein
MNLLNLKNKKYYYLLKFKSIFLNYNYLCFIKEIDNNLINKLLFYKIGILKVQATFLKSLFINNDFFYFLKNNHNIIYFNNFDDYLYLNKYIDKKMIFSFS